MELNADVTCLKLTIFGKTKKVSQTTTKYFKGPVVGGSEYNFSVVPALLTVYLLHELKVLDKRVYDKRQNENNPY